MSPHWPHQAIIAKRWFVAKEVCILGQVCDSTDTRVVAEIYKGNGGTAITGGATNITYSTMEQSTHGAWNGTQFTAPIPGYYMFECGVRTTANHTAGPSVFVDGVERAFMGFSNTASYFFGNRMVYLNAGQVASIRLSTNATLSNDPISHFISIHRISGPSAIAASESVNARATTTGNSIPNNALTIVNFGSVVFDSHGAITPGAAWSFKAPTSGKYRISSGVLFSDTTSTATFELFAYKDGLPECLLGGQVKIGATSASVFVGGSATVSLLAGQALDIRVQQNTGAALALDTATAFGVSVAPNSVSIERIGN